MFGVRLNTVNVSGSLYLNVIVQGIMNALCLVSMWTVDIPLLGRRGNIVGFMMLTGVSLLTMVLVPECKSSTHQYIRTPSINAQCRSMSINAESRHQ